MKQKTLNKIVTSVLRLVVAMCMIGTATVANAQFNASPAFPGAEGHGRFVTGGRGGNVIHVTNLNDSGTGSLRAAVSGSTKKIIVFDVGGVIALNSDLIIGDNTTILGQTAPSPGITVRYYTVRPGGNNIIRYIRFRRGQERDLNDGADATWQRYKNGMMLDHCSFSWSIDEVASFYSNNNFTMQWCSIAESLCDAGHGKGAHGYGGIWGGVLASFHHNMIAHVANRGPRFSGAKFSWAGYSNNTEYGDYKWQNFVQAENVDFRNCVTYNAQGTCYGGTGGGQINMVNNYFKAGPRSNSNQGWITQVSVTTNDNAKENPDLFGMTARYYISGNTSQERSGAKTANRDWAGVTFDSGVIWDGGEAYSLDPGNYYSANTPSITRNGQRYVKIKMDQPTAKGYVTTHTADAAYNKVLAFVGASLNRDNVDSRHVTECTNGTATYKGSKSGTPGLIDLVSDVNGYTEANFGTGAQPAGYDADGDGIPDSWELAHGLPTNINNATTYNLDSKKYYTDVEVYANSLVQHITKQERDGGDAFMEYYPLDNYIKQAEVFGDVKFKYAYGQRIGGSVANVGSATVEARSLKFSNSYNSGANYINITLDKALAKGDKIYVRDSLVYNVANNKSAYTEVRFMNGTTELAKVITKSVHSVAQNASTEVFSVPEAAYGCTSIRIARNGGTEMYVPMVVVTNEVEPVAVGSRKKFDFIAGKDGDVNEAIIAANNYSGTGRFLIFVPNGTHQFTLTERLTWGSTQTKDLVGTDGTVIAPGQSFTNAMTLLKKSNVSIIGQSMDGVILTNTPTFPGISYTSTLEVRSGSGVYLQDFTLRNNYANGAHDKGVAVAFYDRGTNTIMKNINMWSNQDTYTSAATRSYYETCKFAGCVDFICGSGDIWFEKCNLIINNRGGNVITAPATKEREAWGYVFNQCTIDRANGATLVTDGNWTLGRPWKEAPASTFINTKMYVKPSTAGWTNMNAGLKVRFHEYGSVDGNGNLINLSGRSVAACAGATSDNPVLTAAQAAEYTVANVVGYGGWDPVALAAQVRVTGLKLDERTLSWDDSDKALCWFVFKDGVYYDNVTTPTIRLAASGVFTVRAANSMGGLGPASNGVQFDGAPTVSVTATLTHTAAVQGGSNAAGTSLDADTHYYNNWGTAGWAAQAYIGFEIPAVPHGKRIKSATLSFTSQCGGAKDGRTVEVYCIPSNEAANFDFQNPPLSAASGAKVGSATDNRTASRKTFDVTDFISDLLSEDASANVVFQLGAAAAGANLQGKTGANPPSLVIVYEEDPDAVPDELELNAAIIHTAAVQGGSNAAGNSVDQDIHYYNNWGSISWAAQAYVGFYAEKPEGMRLKSATLTFRSYCGGDKNGRAVDVYCLDKEAAATFDYQNVALSAASGTKVATLTDNLAATGKTVDVTSVLSKMLTETGVTPVVFQISGAVAGAYMYGKTSNYAPTLKLEFERMPETLKPNSDMTSYIINPTVDGQRGWTCEKSVNGNGPMLNNDKFEYWSYTQGTGGFDYYQTIEGLPNGIYTLSATMMNDQAANAGVFVPATGVYATSSSGTVYGLVTNYANGTGLEAMMEYSTAEIAVTDGVLRVGVKSASTTMPARWFVADDFRLTYVGPLNDDYAIASFNEALEAAQAAQGKPMVASASTALDAAIAKWSEFSFSTADEYLAAATELSDATTEAQTSIDAYLAAKYAIDKANAIMAETNVHTAEAYNTYRSATDAMQAKYESGQLTNTEALDADNNLNGGTAYKPNGNPMRPFYSSAWTTTNGVELYTNNWSVEGDNDGSNYSTPFLEYWVADRTKLGNNTISATLTGLESGKYKVTAWVRVMNAAGTGFDGFTMTANNASKVFEGPQRAGNFALEEMELTATVQNDGTLTIAFDVQDTNSSWLSIKGVKYEQIITYPDMDEDGVVSIADLCHLISKLLSGSKTYKVEQISKLVDMINEK